MSLGEKNRVHQRAFLSLSLFKDVRESRGRDLRQEFHGGRVYMCARDRDIGFKNRNRRECWEGGGGAKIGGEIGLTGIALSKPGVRGALSVISPVPRLML